MSHTWPPLPQRGFIKGRPATEADVAEGRALFVLRDSSGYLIGYPVEVPIPSYGFVTDEKTGQRLPAILVQAEELPEQQLAGVRLLDGSAKVSFLQKFEFADSAKPHR